MNIRDWLYNDESAMKQIPDGDKAGHGPMKILDLE